MGSGEKKMKRNKQKKKPGGEEKRQTITDDRFAAAQSDPRFMEAPKKRSKVSIDCRFNRVFTDKRFTSSNAPTDKRGKPNKDKKAASSSLKHYYRLKQPEEDEEPNPPTEEPEKDLGNENGTESEGESEKSNDNLEEDNSDLDESSSTSTSDSDSDEQFVDEEEEEDTFMQPEDVPEIEQETRRLAVVNLDWGQVRAVDLYVLLGSFLPKEGQIISVSVYPSEFGLKRMAEEAVQGPVGLFDGEGSDNNEDDDEIDNKKLRAYELSKLKYYYAVVECDSIATADYLYSNCDGVEFERSANKLDLRFIPDSMEFNHKPRDVATEAPAGYDGLSFETRALQHSNVELTWDEDEPLRTKTLKRNLTDEQLNELELKEILASDESESDADEKASRYRALIQSGNASDDEHDEDDEQEMEVTFNSGLEDLSKRILEKRDRESETVWEAHLRKRKEKKKASKNRSKYSDGDSDMGEEQPAEEADDFFVDEPSATKGKGNPVKRIKRSKTNQEHDQEEAVATRDELELLLLATDDQGPDAKGYNLKPKKKKGKGKKGDVEKLASTVDYEDPRFSSLFTSPLFALDPTDPQFKRSATYVRQVAEKQKVGDRENAGGSDTPVEVSRGKEDLGRMSKIKEKNELSSLVKSVKMKSKELALSRSQDRRRRSKSGK